MWTSAGNIYFEYAFFPSGVMRPLAQPGTAGVPAPTGPCSRPSTCRRLVEVLVDPEQV